MTSKCLRCRAASSGKVLASAVSSRLSEGRSYTNKVELFLSKPVQIVFGKAAVAKQLCEHEWKDGVAVVVPSVDLPATLGQPAFQIPQLRRSLDLRGSIFCFPDEVFQLFA